MHEWVKEVTIDMIPETYHDIVEQIGMEHFFKLAQAFGGRTIYIPKSDIILRPIRDKRIKEEFNGYNHVELARKYDLTEKWVREICGPTQDKNQLDLFEYMQNTQ
ncbi:hypothetical protein KQI79_04140 [Paenibacillus sp. MSJ-34]|nr:Mor transcription activator family protein [Paenibacillus sp. MSJ-34]MBU5441226.1 hypothetical protein [Paenibacillus sp. MSJ-34]